MAVFKSGVQVHDTLGQAIGAGMAYVHLRQPAESAQRATGTVSLKSWTPDGDAPASLLLDDGRTLTIEVSRNVLSECSSNHILRYQADWPPVEPGAASNSER